ncbi:MAG: hypothetical protein R2777_06360 [Chitinophagales bacterium]
MQNKLNIFLAFGLLTGLWACVAEPKYPNEPRIEYVSVSTTEEYVQASVFASLTISFTDGNGDGVAVNRKSFMQFKLRISFGLFLLW